MLKLSWQIKADTWDRWVEKQSKKKRENIFTYSRESFSLYERIFYLFFYSSCRQKSKDYQTKESGKRVVNLYILYILSILQYASGVCAMLQCRWVWMGVEKEIIYWGSTAHTHTAHILHNWLIYWDDFRSSAFALIYGYTGTCIQSNEKQILLQLQLSS